MPKAPPPPDPKLDQRVDALRQDPGLPGAADILDRLCAVGRAKEALPLARAALELRPEDPVLRRSMGRALLAQGDLQGAQTTLLALLKERKQDGDAMLLMAEVLLQKADAPRARTMLMHAGRILGDDQADVERLRLVLGEVTGEVRPLGRKSASRSKKRMPPGPLIGGKGAILNVEDDDVAELRAPDRLVKTARVSAGPAARAAWIGLTLLLLGTGGVTYWRMHSTAGRVETAVSAARAACRQGSLTKYRAAHQKLEGALRADPTSPDLRAWLAKVEARMALEYRTGTSGVPATLSRAETAQQRLAKHPPGWFERLQAALGLAYRGADSGGAEVAEASSILKVLQGVQPGPTATAARARTLAELDAAVTRYPGSLGLRYVRGLARLAAGDPVKARADLEAVVAKDKDHVPAQLALAGLLLERGHVVDAQERFNRVLGVTPGSLRARLGLVLTRLVRGKELAQAERDLRLISPRKGTPRLIRAWYSLAQAWMAYGHGKLKTARERVRDAGRSLLSEPQWLAWYVRLALLLGDVGRARRPLYKGLAALRSGDDPLVRAFELEVKLMEGAAAEVLRGAQALRKTLRADDVAAQRVALVYARALAAQSSWSKAARVFAALHKAGPEHWDRPLVALYGAYARWRVHPAVPAEAKTAGHHAPIPPALEALLKRYDKGFSRPIVAYVRARLHMGTPQEAAFLEKARRDHRDAAPAGIRLAELVLASGDVPRANRLLNVAFALAPAYYPALRVRARIRRAEGRGEDAMADLTALCYAGVRVKLPRGLLARIRWTGRWGGRLARMDRSTLCPSPLARPEDLYLRARIYLERQSPEVLNLARLYTALGEAAGGAPYRATLLRARIALAVQLPPKAAKTLVKALKTLAKKNPLARVDPRTLETLSSAQQAAGEVKDAAKTLGRVVAAHPHRLGAWLELAWLRLAQGEQAAAIGAFRKALAEAQRRESDPVSVQAQLQLALGRALMKSGKARNLAAAQKAFEVAARLDPQLFQALVDQARVALLRKKPALARKRLEEVLRYDAGHPEALLLLGQLLRRGSPADRGRVAGLVDRLVHSARVEAKQGRLADARDYLERALARVAPGHPGASLALAELLWRDPKARPRAHKLLARVLAAGTPAQKKRARAIPRRPTGTAHSGPGAAPPPSRARATPPRRNTPGRPAPRRARPRR